MGINLSKNQTINLSKDNGGALRNIRLGLGWDAAKRGLFGGGSIDLDASAVVISNGTVVDTVYFGCLTSNDGSIRHTGDNLTGAGDGDDESIIVDLTRVPAHVDAIVFTVNSFRGQTFDKVANAYVRVVDSDDRDRELAKYSLSGGGSHTAMVMSAVKRTGNGWSFTALGVPGEGRRVQQVTALALQSI